MSPWIWQGLIFCVIGLLIGVLTSHYYYRKGRQVRQPLWCTWSALLADTFTSQESLLRLSYNGEDFSSISVSWVMIWNNGTLAIEKSSVARANPLTIAINPRFKILESKVVSESDAGNDVRLELAEDGSAAMVEFAHFNHRQGCLISLLHSGRSGSVLSVRGAVVNGEPPREVRIVEGRPRSLAKAASLDIYTANRDAARFALKHVAGSMILSVVVFVGVTFLDQSSGEALAVAFVFFIVLMIPGTFVHILFGERIAYSSPIGLDTAADSRASQDYWDRWIAPREPFL